MDQITFNIFYETIQKLCQQCDLDINSVINSELENWNIFRIQLGSLGYVGSGVISSITSPLSENNIPLFYICTFDTDFVLVKSKHLKKALKFLRRRFEVEVSDDIKEQQSEINTEDYGSSCSVPIELGIRDYQVLLASLNKDDKADCMKDLIKFICFPSESMNFIAIVETSDEISLLMDEQFSNDSFEHFEKLIITDPWSPLQRQSKSGFDEIGVISYISKPLADLQISVLYISTYNTGFVMVNHLSTQDAVNCLIHQPNISIPSSI
eukprot:gb/GECH01009279.1/.p1 GENE.gb/GECH01009279.1/~~gb/GECH01009279.1/.p1  ORF type:complete len:267 (+),score=75.91 gb/GECH01009279.1/:1-801(+)